jgi:hypothetical protein
MATRREKKLVQEYVRKIFVPVEAVQEDFEHGVGSIFLAGPTPRDAQTSSWRPEFIRTLAKHKVDCTALIPEQENGKWHNNYEAQCEWEYFHLHHATAIIVWVPRELEHMPTFTTNVEFGYWLGSKKMFYGRPDDAPKTRYLDWMYKKEYCERPASSMDELIDKAVKYLQE